MRKPPFKFSSIQSSDERIEASQISMMIFHCSLKPHPHNVLPIHLIGMLYGKHVCIDSDCVCVSFGSKIMINLTSFFLHGNMLWHKWNQWSEWVV